jgi:hypothetical protein
MENLFFESPVHRTLLFDALRRAMERADDRQDTPTALPTISAPSIATEAVAPLDEAPSAFSNAVAVVAAVERPAQR